MDGSSDCTMSLSRWQTLTATRMRKTVVAAAGAGATAEMGRLWFFEAIVGAQSMLHGLNRVGKKVLNPSRTQEVLAAAEGQCNFLCSGSDVVLDGWRGFWVQSGTTDWPAGKAKLALELLLYLAQKIQRLRADEAGAINVQIEGDWDAGAI